MVMLIMNNKVNIAITVAIALALIGSSVPIPAVFSQTQNTQNYSSAGGSGDGNSIAKKTIRIGYFPNINHAQAVIGLGRGDFQKILGNNIDVKTQIFNAGPAAIEGLLANQIDVTFVGPGPAINGYVRSDGQALRIISGVASGGAVFVVRNDAGINSPQDLANKRFASPELGNTQDIALRKYLLDHGYKTKENGGNIEVLTVKNPDIITLFLTKQIDGAWVPEPWGERLVKEANGKILVDERELWPPNGRFVTTNLVARTDYLESNPEVIRKLLEANLNVTTWINNSNKNDVINAFNIELQKLTGKTIDQDELNASLGRMEFTHDPIKLSLFQDANDAYALGFLPQKPDVAAIYDLTILDQVLQGKGLPAISTGTTTAAAAPTGSTANATNATNPLISSDIG